MFGIATFNITRVLIKLRSVNKSSTALIDFVFGELRNDMIIN